MTVGKYKYIFLYITLNIEHNAKHLDPDSNVNLMREKYIII